MIKPKSYSISDSELERFADETFLETALPLKENIPVKDFCNLTEPLIL